MLKLMDKKLFTNLCSKMFFTLTPYVSYQSVLLHYRPTALWILLIADNMVFKLMASAVFSATSLFINNSVTPDQAGSVNGLSMTITSISR